MEGDEYIRLAEYEQWYWWYRAQRRVLVDTVSALRVRAGARVLDAGCGTGRNLIELRDVFAVRGYGVDVSPRAGRLWNGAVGIKRQLGSINGLAFADGRFDVVFSVDVLCCEGVDPGRAMGEMVRVLRGDGAVVVMVPAYQWMLSRHDRAVHCVRRFSRAGLRVLMERAGLRVQRLTHLFGAFLPIVVAKRWLDARRRVAGPPRSDLAPIPRPLNAAFYALARVEHVLARHVCIPVGSTILAVGHKER